MAHPDLPPDPTTSITAAELRRRLLASTPPPPGAAVADPDPAGSGRTRLTMPGANGPVAASTLPPVVDQTVPEVPILPSRSRIQMLDAGALALLGGGTQVMEAPPAPAPAATGGKGSDDYKRLKHENRELRKLLEEMKQLLQEASDNEQGASTREADLRTQLADKQRQIDELTAQLHSIEEQVASGALTHAPAQPKTRTELEEWADDLEKEAAQINKDKRELEEERKQLRDDEQSLEKQMRDMEVGMARERAMMARQETELKRLSAEIQHELELMQKGDGALREQLAKFQRRAADVLQGRMGPGGPGGKK